MKIVGVGCGRNMLTREAVETIRSAKLLYGSDRALEIAKEYFASDAKGYEITDYKALRSLPDDAVVLSTGDPMMAGLGYLDGDIVSGISSMQCAFARLHAMWTNVAVVNAHGKNHRDAMELAARDIAAGHSVFIIADPEFSVEELASHLPKDTRIAVCSNLGYEDEEIAQGTAEHPPKVGHRLFSVVCGY